MAFGIEGRKVRLVPCEPDRHLENCVRWLNDPEVTRWLLVGQTPTTRANEKEFFDKVGTDPSEIAFAIETLDGVHIGMSGIHRIQYQHGVCRTGSFIGETAFWGQGFGTDSAYIRARYIFEILGLRMIITEAIEGNVRSLGMSKRIGFKECGFIPNRWWRLGKHVGEHLLYLERDMLKDPEG